MDSAVSRKELLDQSEKLSEKMHVAWGELRQSLDTRLEQIEKKGVSEALLDEKIAKINEAIDSWDQRHQETLDKIEAQEKARVEREERLEKLEISLKRPGAAKGEDLDEKALTRRAFLSWARSGRLTADEAKLLTPIAGVDIEEKVLVRADDTTGGYLAPPDYRNEIIKDVVEFSPIRQYARVIPTTRQSVQVPTRTGTFSAVWVAENLESSEATGLAWGLENIQAHEMRALVDVSNQNLEDSAFNLEAELRMEFAEQFGVAEGTAFVSGSGSGRPEGILTASSVTERATTGSSNTIDTDDLFNALYADLKEPYRANATWFFHRSSIAGIRNLSGNDNFYWAPGFSDTPSTICGRPYREATDLTSWGTDAGTVGIVGDIRRGYAIADRVQIAILRDPYTRMAFGNTRYIARKRVGGQVVLGEAIVKLTT